MNMQHSAAAFMLFICISVISCNTVDSGETNDPLNYQKSKCLGQDNLYKAELDSCFTYSFINNLVVEFCAVSNCCPDSNRYTFRQYIGTDTLDLTITDIEEHLCHCACSYLLHSEFTDLPQNSYHLNIYQEFGIERTLLYSEDVIRQ